MRFSPLQNLLTGYGSRTISLCGYRSNNYCRAHGSNNYYTNNFLSQRLRAPQKSQIHGMSDWKASEHIPQPNPGWKFGDGANVKQEDKTYKTWDLESTPPAEAYSLLISTVIPRPIAFVSSLSKDNIPNLAPFSYFSLIGANPPLLSVSFTLPTNPALEKDTRENILATKEFTVNIISETFIEAANSTSIVAPPHISEWTISGLTPTPSISVKPARVGESAISFECVLYSHQDIKPLNSTTTTLTLVLGLIKKVHVSEAVLKEDGTVDPSKVRAVSRLGGTTYGRIGDTFDIKRPSWRESKDVIEELVSQKL